MNDSNETRRTRFKRLAQKRTNDVIDKLRILGNLANKSSYDYSEGEINKMFKAIDDQLRTVKARFKPKRRKFRF